MIALFVFAMLFVSSIAVGQELLPDATVIPDASLLPTCIDVSEVPMTWGWFGGIAVAVITGLTALRPFSLVLLKASSFLGPRAHLAAKAFYALGQVAAVFCVGRPKFAVEAEKPQTAKATAKPADETPATTAQLPAPVQSKSDLEA